jgi:aspartyl-tRNA(Asn)/glutamyl-tRNA(Gln) amidotransferase subunit C
VAISLDDARHVASLARLDLKTEELELYTKQLNTILDYAQELQSLDTQNIKPTFYAVDAHKALREDVVHNFDNGKQIIDNGPEVSGTSFVVPRIL